jgi:RLL motif containing protein 1
MTSQRMKEAEQNQTSAPSVKSVNPFDNLDCEFLVIASFCRFLKLTFPSTVASPQFEAGVRALAEKLNIPHHPDHLQVLAAVSRVIKDNLNKESLKQPILEGNPFPIFEGQGMNQSDEDVEQAARILRLLQIQSIRGIQTIINETIVETQSFTTDTPKTDTRLGQVGR